MVASLLVDNLAFRGVHVESVVCDVRKRGDVINAIEGAPSAGRPARGSYTQHYLPLSELSFETLAAKTLGTLDLHEAIKTLPLDFFEHFARYRQRLGLPTSTLAYGSASDGDSDFKHSSKDGKGDAKNGDTSDGATSLPSASRLRHAFDEAIRAGPEKRTITVSPAIEDIASIISEMLFIDITNGNPNKSVVKHGVDSLVAAELRHWLYQALETNLHMLDLLDTQTSIKVLVEIVIDKVLKDGVPAHQ
ncbi:hypothetical protein F5Y10DRAFT_273769 [Nemania abortiva]|nr:hypothetical protein F5Y10DRAFT_273769 [Nemania abortiva]